MTTMSVQPILGSRTGLAVLESTLPGGWSRADLFWERLQERANQLVERNRPYAAALRFVLADAAALLCFDTSDPRRATSTANLAFAFRCLRLERAARRFYRIAISDWSSVPRMIEDLEIRPQARSSLYHLRMEARHWETYKENRRVRLRSIAAETASCLEALRGKRPVPHRLFSRWLGEKPPIPDDVRKLLGACLLVASPP